jgi:hypothetical protein
VRSVTGVDDVSEEGGSSRDGVGGLLFSFTGTAWAI